MHRPRKRFGQNFLQSDAIIAAIIHLIRPQPRDKLLEIGPGLGALTLTLLKQVEKLYAIEIDKDLIAHFNNLGFPQEKLNIIEADALTVDYQQWGEGLRVVGNLPYNISTPLLLHLLTFSNVIDDMHFMLQKEVVSRITAVPGTKAYGRLTVMIQYFCEVEALLDVPPEAFYPPPKVNSQIVRLMPYKKSPFASVSRDLLEKVVAVAFSMRRKTITNTLKPLLSVSQLEALGFDVKARPEQLSVRDYVTIANFIGNQTLVG